jgi:hypothetical protein
MDLVRTKGGASVSEVLAIPLNEGEAIVAAWPASNNFDAFMVTSTGRILRAEGLSEPYAGAI